MRVLAVSDEVNSLLYSPFAPRIAGNIDLILSCGDLPAYYLDYLVSTLGKPLLYVCGNHDRYDASDSPSDSMNDAKSFVNSHLDYHNKFNFGGRNIDNRTEKVGGLIIGGLEGSLAYNRGEHQYSESQMRSKIMWMTPSLLWNRLTQGRFLDILVTHAPPRSIHDRDDLAHRGFDAYRAFIRCFRPKYLLHGHTHIYDRNENRVDEYYGTRVINCFNFQVLDLNLE